MPHIDVSNILNIVGVILLAVITQVVRSPKDHERAQLLTTLAESAAAVIVNAMPNAEWPRMVQAVVARIAGESTVPTTNMKKIENAATTALVKLGKAPPPAETP